MDEEKEMTELGRVQRLGDLLTACMHRAFTQEADWMLEFGTVSQEERIALSSAVGTMLQTFNSSVPEELRTRIIGADVMIRSEYIPEGMKEFFKEFDTSEWSGVASNWDSAEAYCKSCLIDVSGAEKRKSHCMLPLTKQGSSTPNINALRAMGGGRGITAVKKPADVSQAVWSSALKKAAKRIAGLWKSAFDKEPPESIVALTKESNGVAVLIKLEDGYHMLGIYSNKFLDRDEEIIPEEDHKAFAEWVTDKGFRPALTTLHQPTMPNSFWKGIFDNYSEDIPKLNEVVRAVYQDFALGEVERIVYVNGFTAYSAKIYDDKAEIAEKIVATSPGHSHGFILSDKIGNLLKGYRSFEISLLPVRRAANLLTPLLGVVKALREKLSMGDKGLSAADREFIVQTYGDDFAQVLETMTEDAEKRLEPILAFKAMVEEEEEEDMPEDEKVVEEVVVEETPQFDYETLRNKIFEDLKVVELAKAVSDLVEGQQTTAEAVKSLLDKVQEVSDRLNQVEKTEDEKIAEAFTAPVWPGVKTQVQREDNVITAEEKKELVKEPPATDPAKVLAQEDNIMSKLIAPLLQG